MKGSEFSGLEVQQMAPVPSSAPAAKESSRLSRGALCWMVLAIALGITALVLGAYATNQVLTLSYPPTYLVSRPTGVPAGFR